MRERWPISDADRLRIVARLCKVFGNDLAEDRHVIGAARALIAADQLNLEQQKFDHAVGETGIPAVKDALTEAEERADALKPARPPDAGGSTPGAAGPVP